MTTAIDTRRSKQLHVLIRWGIRKDLAATMGIEDDCFEYPWSEQEFLEYLRQRNVIWMVAEHEERIVGYMVYELNPRSLRLLNFAVHPGVWRRKVGTALIAKLTGKLSVERRNRITVDVRESNLDGQLFFKACGFEAVAIVESPYRDNDEDAFHFVYRLRTEVFRIAE